MDTYGMGRIPTEDFSKLSKAHLQGTLKVWFFSAVFFSRFLGGERVGDGGDGDSENLDWGWRF